MRPVSPAPLNLSQIAGSVLATSVFSMRSVCPASDLTRFGKVGPIIGVK
ncbi:MAG: hypothetical protein H0T48_08925 [Gemmatimonadaceae bacterium]|nr:hypothetical protein [Gemmatimonadaceae bacterium]